MTYLDYLDHVTVSTGHRLRSPRSAVSEAAMAATSTWLERALGTPERCVLPGPLAHYSAAVERRPGGLAATLYSPAGEPLLIFATARRTRNAAPLWQWLTGLAGPGNRAGEAPPSAPWLAALPLAHLAQDGAAGWSADYSRCVAWAWIERRAA
ncbi:MAG: hypothetical protein E7K72_25055 [Roseomonas mucosa]|uniref:hypothetical protein n=1 Tax=Roseomonas mucosa TaxID=207340 RepID=UPI0022480DFB|nr:hypothetical protein [Roseomonas mucosa]MDU7524599.1 hypothetical protein [Roseomonas mucosa]UZO91814.1 Hypothetical protein RMP42_05963 [Roseomonas mucosa]